MWAELPENKHNDAPQNERIYESELPTFTTDVRMEKVGELFASSEGHAVDREQVQGSGGGGPVEAVYWIKETGTQWRIAGKAFVVGEDIEGDGNQSSGVRTVKSEVGARMRAVKEGEWSWGKELTAHFGNCSPGMRGKVFHTNENTRLAADAMLQGTWRNPPPGTPATQPPDKEHELGQKVSDLHDPIARKNFRVVIIVPDTVEQTDISDPENSRRWKYTFVAKEGKGGWEKVELWP